MPGTSLQPFEYGFSTHAARRAFELFGSGGPLALAEPLATPHYAERALPNGEWDPTQVRMRHLVLVAGVPYVVIVGDNGRGAVHLETPKSIVTIIPLVERNHVA